MPDPSLVSLFVRPLNQLRIPYLITGGVASVIYGEPRFTRDIDLVLRLEARDARRFAAAWPAAEYYVPPVEVLTEESQRPVNGHFNVSHHQTAMRADIYLPGEDPLTAWALEHPTQRHIEGDDVSVAPIEAVILSKLRYFKMGKSDRHLRDIRQMLSISGELVDGRLVDRWAGRLQLDAEWRLARAGG